MHLAGGGGGIVPKENVGYLQTESLSTKNLLNRNSTVLKNQKTEIKSMISK